MLFFKPLNVEVPTYPSCLLESDIKVISPLFGSVYSKSIRSDAILPVIFFSEFFFNAKRTSLKSSM